MNSKREIHPKFLEILEFKDAQLVALFKDVRSYLLELYPQANEILYHTHALTSVFSVSEKLSGGFCHIPIYTKHLNLGFNKGVLLDDPSNLLKGTGKLIRHIPISIEKDYRNKDVTALVKKAIKLAQDDLEEVPQILGQNISKIK